MMKISKTKWTERKFNFNFPVSHFPYIIERLSGVHARIKEKTANLSEDKLTLRPNGKWSIKEHIGHLIDLEELHEGRITDFITGLSILRAADMSNKKTNEAHHNIKNIEDLLDSFNMVRNQFIKKLQEMDETSLSKTSIHPRLNQPMRLIDMAFFVAEHDDFHLVCINEILELSLTH